MDELLKTAVSPLLEWYRLSKRDLPWRRDRTPYSVLVSELMLQQTRVEAVRERYVAFMEKFPTPRSLAEADEEEVLKAWEGLGYYSRARNLRRAACFIAEHGFPDTYEGVRALTGVGDYTAGAISSIALGLPTPAVDGNVVRILSRLHADGTPQDALKREYAARLAEVYPPRAGEFTEALMELGAIVCVPNGRPLCGACPWEGLCRAHAAGCETCYPVRAPKKERKVVHATVLVLRYADMYAIEKRDERGLLAGLWQFPFFEKDAPDFGETLQTKRAKHVFTHIEWRMTGKLVAAREKYPGYVWATADEIRTRYAVPSAFKAFFGWLT